MKNLRMIAVLMLVVAAVLVSCGPTYYIPYPFPGTGEKEDGTELDMSWQTEATGTSESDPYVLATVGDVRGLAAMVEAGQDFDGSYFALEPNAEYDFSSIPDFQIGSGDRKNLDNSNVFRGVFDGNGATISGLNLSAEGNASDDNRPFGFIAIAEDATVKNLKFENCVVNADTSSVGLAVGYAENCNIENITVENCKVTGAEGVGAIAGRLIISKPGKYFVRNNTNVNASVVTDSTYHAGGIIGYVSITVGMDDAEMPNTTVVFDNNSVTLNAASEISCSAESGIATAAAISGSVGGYDRVSDPGRVPFEFTNNTITLNDTAQIKATGNAKTYRGLLYAYSTVDGIPDITVDADDNNKLIIESAEPVTIISNVTPAEGEIANFLTE